MEDDIISPWWISLFLFAVPVSVFAVVGLLHMSWEYARFGIGFGLGLALMPLWIAPLLEAVSGWSGPVVLFLGVPVVMLSLLCNICLCVWVGVLFYGRKQWGIDGEKELAEKLEEEPTK